MRFPFPRLRLPLCSPPRFHSDGKTFPQAQSASESHLFKGRKNIVTFAYFGFREGISSPLGCRVSGISPRSQLSGGRRQNYLGALQLPDVSRQNGKKPASLPHSLLHIDLCLPCLKRKASSNSPLQGSWCLLPTKPHEDSLHSSPSPAELRLDAAVQSHMGAENGAIITPLEDKHPLLS